MENNEFNITVIEAMKLKSYERADAASDDPHSSRNVALGEIAAYNKVLRLLRKQDEES